MQDKVNPKEDHKTVESYLEVIIFPCWKKNKKFHSIQILKPLKTALNLLL